MVKVKDKGMNGFMELHGKEVGLEIQRLLPRLRNIYETDGIQSVVDYVWSSIDQINDRVGITAASTCFRGCSICCNGNIHVSSLEASYITSYVKQYEIPVKKREVKRLAKVKNIDDLPLGKRMCPLLDSKNECSIYERRPSICRVYNSTDDPKLCDIDKHKKTTGTGRTVQSFALYYSLFELDIELGFMEKDEDKIPLHKALYMTRKHR
jgi:Fe-S-cluster containining protein